MGSAIFRHYLITRFNLRKEGWNTAKDKSPVLTEKWLSNRFLLFERFCFSTVKNQTNKNFTWLVFFDKNTPPGYKERAIGYTKELPNIQPFFIDGMPEFLSYIQNEIQKNDLPYTITTRMDNDDCVSKYFINEIQKNFVACDLMAIDFADGYTMQIAPALKIGKRKQLYNPFISLVEKNFNAKSVWSREPHSIWKKEKNVKRINNKRVWMSVIHLENKINQFVGYGNVTPEKVFKDFIIDKHILAQFLSAGIKKLSNFQSFKNRLSSNWRTIYKDIKRKAGLYK